MSVTLLSETKYVEIIMKQLKEISENMLDAPDIHIDNTWYNNKNVSDNMTKKDNNIVVTTQDEHSVTTTDEKSVV